MGGLLLKKKIVSFLIAFLFCSSFVGCLGDEDVESDDDVNNEDVSSRTSCDDEKPIFEEDSEQTIADYIYHFTQQNQSTAYQMQMDRYGGFTDFSEEEISNKIWPEGLCDFHILNVDETDRCVLNANSITNLHISYKLGWNIKKGMVGEYFVTEVFEISEIEEYYSIAKSNYEERWGVYPSGGFPTSHDCNLMINGDLNYADDYDNDGLKNHLETKIYQTDAESNDTDNDGLNDYDELFVYYTNPLSTDTDGDGLTDFFEVKRPDIYEGDLLINVFNEELVGYWSFDEDEGVQITH